MKKWINILILGIWGISLYFAARSCLAQSKPENGNDTYTRHSGDEFPDWLKSGGIIAGLASPGITVWYVWYDLTKVKPRIERTHVEQVNDLIERYTKQLREAEERHAAHWTLANTNARGDLHEMNKMQREDIENLREGLDALRASFDRLGERIGCKYERGE